MLKKNIQSSSSSLKPTRRSKELYFFRDHCQSSNGKVIMKNVLFKEVSIVNAEKAEEKPEKL
jgi:hypothetical protein